MSVSKHSAPGPAAGYIFQFERALNWLARADAGAVIGIETADDVSIEEPDGRLTLEQDKHSITDKSPPFSNRSKSLWNSLGTWIEFLLTEEAKRIEVRFFLVTNKLVPEGVARQIHSANDTTAVNQCIEALESAAIDPPKSLEALMTKVLSAESRLALRQLVTSCNLLDASDGTANEDLRANTIKALQLPEFALPQADHVINTLLGWVVTTSQRSWQHGNSARIQRNHFVNELHAILDQMKRRQRWVRAEHLLDKNIAEDDVEAQKGSQFVRQLHLVTEDDMVVDIAIRDFLRCSIEKIRLSAEGEITDGDWIDFSSTLQSRWKRISTNLRQLRKMQAEDILGYEIYSETTTDYREKLAGIDTEQTYLTAGSYHRLADKLEVGWHPRFGELLGE